MTSQPTGPLGAAISRLLSPLRALILRRLGGKELTELLDAIVFVQRSIPRPDMAQLLVIAEVFELTPENWQRLQDAVDNFDSPFGRIVDAAQDLADAANVRVDLLTDRLEATTLKDAVPLSIHDTAARLAKYKQLFGDDFVYRTRRELRVGDHKHCATFQDDDT